MMRVLLLALSMSSFAANGRAGRSRKRSPFRVAAYLPEYRMGGIDWAALGSRATDVILFSVEPAPDGSIAHLSRLPQVVMDQARVARQAHGVRLVVCVGGAGRSASFGLLAQPPFRKKFGQSLLAFAMVEKLDGLDFDWEGQVGANEDTSLSKLLSGIRKAAKKNDYSLKLSVTVHPGDVYPESFKAANFVHLMSYDSCDKVPCRHATFETAKSHVQHILTAGVPAHKLLLGIPAYARQMDKPQEAKTYTELISEHGSLPPEADEAPGGWYFNGIATVVKKSGFAMGQGLGGVFFWEAGQDTNDAATSLLHAVRASLPPSPTPVAVQGKGEL